MLVIKLMVIKCLQVGSQILNYSDNKVVLVDFQNEKKALTIHLEQVMQELQFQQYWEWH